MTSTSLARPSAGSEPSSCAFCGKNLPCYTCPSCNAAYCSLSCYRAQAHGQCTESFYRKAIEHEIRIDRKNRTKEERESVIDMLKRLEGEESFEDNVDNSEDYIKESSLAARLQNVNLDGVTSDELWAALDDEERAAFTKLLKDPDGEAAKEILAFHDSHSQAWRPWWEVEHEDETDSPYQQMVASWKSLNVILQGLSAPLGKYANSLLYNIVAVTLSYAFTTRHLIISPLSISLGGDSQDASREDMAKTAPFLLDRRSNVALCNVEEATTYIWSRIDSVSSAFIIQLLRDALVLLKVPLITPQINASPTPLRLVLSDLFHLFRDCSVMRPDPTAMKIKFYAAQVASIPTSTLDGLRREIENQIQKIMASEQDKYTPGVSRPALMLGGKMSEQRCAGHQESRNPSVEEV